MVDRILALYAAMRSTMWSVNSRWGQRRGRLSRMQTSLCVEQTVVLLGEQHRKPFFLVRTEDDAVTSGKTLGRISSICLSQDPLLSSERVG